MNNDLTYAIADYICKGIAPEINEMILLTAESEDKRLNPYLPACELGDLTAKDIATAHVFACDRYPSICGFDENDKLDRYQARLRKFFSIHYKANRDCTCGACISAPPEELKCNQIASNKARFIGY